MVEIKNEALSKAIKDSMVYGKGEVLIIDPKEVLKLQSQNAELKALVRELVEAVAFYSNDDDFSNEYSQLDWDLVNNTSAIQDRGKFARSALSKNKELIEAIKGE